MKNFELEVALGIIKDEEYLRFLSEKGELKFLPTRKVKVKVGTKSKMSSYRLGAVYEDIFEEIMNPEWDEAWDSIPKGDWDESMEAHSKSWVWGGHLYNTSVHPETRAMRESLGISKGHEIDGVDYPVRRRALRFFYENPSEEEWEEKHHCYGTDIWRAVKKEDGISFSHEKRYYMNGANGWYRLEKEEDNILHHDNGEQARVVAGGRFSSLLQLEDGRILFSNGDFITKAPVCDEIKEIETGVGKCYQLGSVCIQIEGMTAKVISLDEVKKQEKAIVNAVNAALTMAELPEGELGELCKQFIKKNDVTRISFGLWGEIISSSVEKKIKGGVLKLKAPADERGRIIGKGGKNIKALTEELRKFAPSLKRIILVDE